METAIQVVWWIGLLGALVPTVVILKEVALVVRTLHGILRLAERTAEAARGVARNLAVADGLREAGTAAYGLRDAARSLAGSTGAVDRSLQRPDAHPPPPGA